VALAKEFMTEKNHHQAIDLLLECLEYPSHLGESKLQGAPENEFHYHLGCVYEALGKRTEALRYWTLAKDGNSEPAAVFFYNDQKPEAIFYQGMALLKLGIADEAVTRFNRLLTFGATHLEEVVQMDYFAVSLPDLLIWEEDLTYRNKVHCLYLQGLGYLGLGDFTRASDYFKQTSDLDPNHQGVQIHRKMLVS